MKRRKKIVRKVLATRSEYIDPANCDSAVGYNIVFGRYFSACVELSDCTRKVQWHFDNDNSSIAKIDKAIEILTTFRGELIQAQQTFSKRGKRK
jgi:hypothetical protein